MRQISRQEYAAAVIECIRIARLPTSGGKVMAQVLLSAYNGDEFQLDVAGLGYLDRKNFHLVMTVIEGRYETGEEPHVLVEQGDTIFRNLWAQWTRLHVEERGKLQCPDCDGSGTVFLMGDVSTEQPCSRCSGKGRVCRCKARQS